ncbi:hypothetical protein CROQUDRAFT_97701 [Cronartium quercuum f. sp. fusiforme G11]|uniref:Uncharacterized protein n=1 Tax=Cronartium quercuum f. sp. fusiforme G11 TaxID=708437 RepID=A0A9P6NEP2_9BASI|nr:hypothetical protein CROQUDRAFT_97701 [Cronartium quercuum f. sp. fusiforme G11]
MDHLSPTQPGTGRLLQPTRPGSPSNSSFTSSSSGLYSNSRSQSAGLLRRDGFQTRISTSTSTTNSLSSTAFYSHPTPPAAFQPLPIPRHLRPSIDLNSAAVPSRPSSAASLTSSLDHDPLFNTTSGQPSSSSLNRSSSSSQVIMFPTRGGVKQRVSILQPAAFNSTSSARARPPMIPVSINNSRLSIFSSTGSQPFSSSSESATHACPRPSITAHSNLSFSEDGHSNASASLDFSSEPTLTSSTPPQSFSNRSLAHSLVSDRDFDGAGTDQSSMTSCTPRQSAPTPETECPRISTEPPFGTRFNGSSDSKPNLPIGIPTLQLSLDDSGTGSLLDFAFDSTLSSMAPNLADFLGRPIPSSSSQASTDSIKDLSSGLTTTYAQADADLGSDSQSSKRDTVKSFADVLKTNVRGQPTSSNSVAQSSSLDGHTRTQSNVDFSLPSNTQHRRQYSSQSEHHSSFLDSHQRSVYESQLDEQFSTPRKSSSSLAQISYTDATPIQQKSHPASSSLLLDLDISGRGPSLGGAQFTSASLKDVDWEGYELSSVKPTKLSSNEGPHLRLESGVRENNEVEDPYSPMSLSDQDDEDEDDRSTHEMASSTDSFPRPPPRSNPHTSPYLPRPPPQRPQGGDHGIHAGCVGGVSSNALKRGMSKLKMPHNKEIGYRDHSKRSLTHACSTLTSGLSAAPSDKSGFINPSPVSSILSLHTTASRSSSRASGSSRMARLISRVTGNGGVNSSGGAPLKPTLVKPPRSDSNLNHAHVPTLNIKSLKKQGSLSNLLGGLGHKDKSRPTDNSSSGHSHGSEPAIVPTSQHVPRKSMDLLMRPFSRNRHHTASNFLQTEKTDDQVQRIITLPSPDPPRPRLAAKRSFDLLRTKLGSGRKSMDELSAFSDARPRKAQPHPQLHSPINPAPDHLSSSSSDEYTSEHSPASQHDHTPAAQPDSRSLAHKHPPPPHGSDTNHSRSLSSTSSSADHHGFQRSPPNAPSVANSGPEPHSSGTRTDHPRPSTESRYSRESKLSSQAAHTSPPAFPRTIDGQSTKEWATLESMLSSFQSTNGKPISLNGTRVDLTTCLTGTLLPFLKVEESHAGSIYINANLMVTHRNILFGWLDLIFAELREPQPASRGACLDGVAGILESHFLASYIINSNPAAVTQYRQTLVSVLSFAVDKLNDKAVYANTLVFAGRMLSMAFFRIEGVARKLLRALPPVKRMSMRRILDEMQHSSSSLSSERPNLQPFPAYLRELCFTDLASYCRVFSTASAENDNVLVQEGNFHVEMSGNWLIRWTASDSDLPFAFYRAYHRQLATYLRPQPNIIVDPLSLVSMPGFLFIAASFLDKCDALVHRSLRSVTTLGPNANNFNAGESANLAMGAKPKVLELAHRRLVSTALDIVGGSPRAEDPAEASSDAGLRRSFFGGLLNVWIRAITKRTSMWDTRSVFLLLDLFDGLFYTVLYTAPSPTSSDIPPSPKLVQLSLRLFDLTFILDVVRRILTTADNTVCVMRTIAFVYSQFEALTIEPKTCEALCLDLLLYPPIFQHLFLHWNSGVRGYYMRLLVWRLSRLGVLNPNQPQSKSREAINIILTFNTRLDAIRKRHDELSPESDLIPPIDDDYRRKRSTICSTRGVTDQPWAINELAPDEVCAETVEDSGREASSGTPSDKPSVAKVVSWLKVVKRLGGSSRPKTAKNELPIVAITPVPAPASSEVDLREVRRSESSQDHPSSPSSTPPSRQVNSDDDESMRTPRKSDSSQRSSHSPDSPTFFKFEFELGAEMPRSDSFDTPITTPAHSEAVAHPQLADSSTTPPKITTDAVPPNPSTPGPRVSSRFSKRASLLPPAALNLLRENEILPSVPTIPAALAFPTAKPAQLFVAYPIAQHPYAIRALAEYEQSLEEEHEWKEKLAEEEEANNLLSGGAPGSGSTAAVASAAAAELIVPRLAVSWPLSFSEDE